MRARLVARTPTLSCPGLTRASMPQAGHRSQDEPWTLGSSPRVTERGREGDGKAPEDAQSGDGLDGL